MATTINSLKPITEYIKNYKELSGLQAVETTYKGGKLSWADSPADVLISAKNINEFNPESILILAAEFDGDIDGKSADGNSITKEGTETFILGANYSGTKGVSVTEVSGLAANIVNGNRVTWTAGDALSYIKGKNNITRVQVDNVESTTNAGSILTLTNADIKIETFAQAGKHYIATIVSPINSAHTFAGFMNNLSIAGIRAKQEISFLSTSITTAAVSSIVNIFGVSHTLNLAPFSYTHNVGKDRFTFDMTNLSTTIYTGVFLSIGRNTFEAYETQFKKLKVDGKQVEFDLTATNFSAEKIINNMQVFSTNFTNNGFVFEKAQAEIVENDVSINASMVSLDSNDIDYLNGNISLVDYTAFLYC